MKRKPSILKTDVYMCARKFSIIDNDGNVVYPKLTINFFTEEGFFVAALPSKLTLEDAKKYEDCKIHELPYEDEDENEEDMLVAGYIYKCTKHGIYGRISKDFILRAIDYYGWSCRVISERRTRVGETRLWRYDSRNNLQQYTCEIITLPDKHLFEIKTINEPIGLFGGLVFCREGIAGVTVKYGNTDKDKYICISAEILLRELGVVIDEIKELIADGVMEDEPDNDFIIHNGVLEKYQGNAEIVVIPDGIHTIGEKAFEFNDYIEEVILSPGVKVIKCDAFNCCNILEKVTLNENVEIIESHAFAYCSSLKFIKLPNSLKELGKCVFYNCKNLTSIVLSENLKIIPESAFEFCKNLKSIIIPDSVEEVEEYAFRDCERLSEIVFPLNIEIKENVFDETIWLKKYLRDNGALVIGDTILAVDENITEYEISETVHRIARFAFSKSNVENLFIPDTVKEIGSYAFSSSNIKNIRLPDGLKIIKEHTFSDCTKLEELIIPNSVERIGDCALYNLPKCILTIKNAEEDNVRIYGSSFGWGAKKACVKKVRAHYGSKVMRCAMLWNLPFEPLEKYTYIDKHFCCEGTKLVQYLGHEKDVIVPKGITEIGKNAFEDDYSSAEYVYLPETVTEIHESAFMRCKSLKKIEGKGVRHIYSHAFLDDEKLENVYFPNLETYDKNTFDRCFALKEENFIKPETAKAIDNSYDFRKISYEDD